MNEERTVPIAENEGWIEIARPGTFTDSRERQVTLTDEELNALASGFDTEQRIPLVFGHPQTNTPAYGWVEALRFNSGTLEARFRQIHDDVKKLVRDGHFKNVSVSLTGDKKNLRHVGLLGAAQPAISGLKEVSFNVAEDCIVLEFSASQTSEVSRLRADLMAAQGYIQALSIQKKEAVKEQKIKRIHDFCKEGKIFPYEIERLKILVGALVDVETSIQFSEGEAPVELVDAFLGTLDRRPDRKYLEMDFAQFAPKPLYSQQQSNGQDVQGSEAMPPNQAAYLI